MAWSEVLEMLEEKEDGLFERLEDDSVDRVV